MEDHGGADICTAACEGTHTTAGGHALKEAAAHGELTQEQSSGRSCSRGEEPTQEQVFWQELWPVGDPHWSSLFLMDCTPWRGPMLEQFLKNYSPSEGSNPEPFMKDYILWEGPHPGAREQLEEEGAAERSCCGLTRIPIPHHPGPLRAGRNEGVMLSLGRREEQGKSVKRKEWQR